MVENPYWSWLLKLVTLWMPTKYGIELSLRGIKLATIDRDAANYRRQQAAEDMKRKVVITGNESREVVHTGGQLSLRGKTIYLGDVLNVIKACPLGFWGKMAFEEGKGTKVEIRLGKPREGTEGVIPINALDPFVTEVRERTVSIRAVWINPDTNKPGEFFANLVVSTPDEQRSPAVFEDELFVFERDGLPRLGSRVYKPRKPNY